MFGSDSSLSTIVMTFVTIYPELRSTFTALRHDPPLVTTSSNTTIFDPFGGTCLLSVILCRVPLVPCV